MRRLIAVGAAVLVTVLGASFFVWRWAEGQLQTQVDRWIANQQAQGWTVAHGAPVGGGWPLAVELTLPDLSLSGLERQIPGGMAWSGERVTLRMAALQPGLATASVSGAQHLRLGANAPLDYTAERFVLSAPLENPPRAAALDAGGLRFADGASIGLLQGQIDVPPGGAARLLRLTAEAIAFPPPPAPQPPLGGHIASATIEAALTGALPPAATDPAAAAAAWQASGGELTVRRLALGWGPLGVSGGGAVSLDAALQPAATANLHLVGFDAALQALATAHAIAPNAARAAGAVLALLATQPQGGGAPAVDVPLTLKDRTLSMGRIPLAKLPQLVWPNRAAAATVSP